MMRVQEAACHPSLEGLSNPRSDTQVAAGSCTQTILGESLGLSHLGLVRTCAGDTDLHLKFPLSS